MRASGAGPEASKPRATGILWDIPYMGSIPTPSAMIDISGEFILFTDIERQFHDD